MRLLALLLIPLVFSILIEYYPIRNKVKVGEYAIYRVIITNDENRPVNIMIKGLSVKEKKVSLNPFEKKVVDIEIECRAASPYKSIVNFEFDGKKISIAFPIYGEPIEWTPRCYVNVFPRGSDVEISANCIGELKGLEVELGNIRFRGRDRILISGLSPGEYSAKVRIFVDNKSIEREIFFEIPTVEKIRKRVIRKEGFFFVKYEILIENLGNAWYTAYISLKKEGKVIKGNLIDSYVVISVPPKGSVKEEVLMIKNLWVFPLMTLLAVCAVLVMRIPPVFIVKEYTYYSTGGRTRVLVTLKLKSWRSTKNIRIVDYVPKYAKNISFETIPGEIRENIIVWEIERIKRGEELYIAYSFECDFEVVKGELKLPKGYFEIKGRIYSFKPKRMSV